MKTLFPIILAGIIFSQPFFASAEFKTNPTDVNDHTPEFSAIYNDQNGGDYATWYRIQVSTSSLGNWAHAKWDSGTTTMATTTESTRSPQISYGGSLLASSTTHYWRIRFSDDDRKEGAWSTATSTFYIDTSCNCATTTIYYIHTDHLSGSNAITNDSGSLVQALDYYPFGSTRVNKLKGDIDEKRKFTGYEHDYSTGLNYAGARYQNPTQGRFVSQDIASRDNPEQFVADPQQMNMYSYGRNNPLMLVDRDGQKVEIYAKGIEGYSFGTHVFLLLTPDNPGDFGLPAGSNWVVGGYGDNGTLIKAINAPSDRSVIDNGYSIPEARQGKLKASAVVQGPNNLTDTGFINRVMGQYDTYGEDAAYDPFSRKGYNSNNLVTSFLRNSGVQELPWGGNAPGIDPGYGQTIPGNYTKANGQIAPSGLGAVSSYSGQQGSRSTMGAIQNTLSAISNTLTSISNKFSGK